MDGAVGKPHVLDAAVQVIDTDVAGNAPKEVRKIGQLREADTPVGANVGFDAELVDRGIVARIANEDIESAPAAHQGVAAAASFHDVRVDAVAGQVGALPARDEPGVTLEGRDG